MFNEKRKIGQREKILFDILDAVILKFIYDSLKEGKKPTITEVREHTGLTHANLTTHLKRLEHLIKRERDKQTIYLSFSQEGEKAMEILMRAFKLGEEVTKKAQINNNDVSHEVFKLKKIKSKARESESN